MNRSMSPAQQGTQSSGDLEQKIELLQDRVRRELSDEQLKLVLQLRFAEEKLINSKRDDWENQLLEVLARHFPGFAPAVRAVAAHIHATGGGTDPECGLGHSVLQDFTTEGCAGTEPT
jgi:hypothetical protein